MFRHSDLLSLQSYGIISSWISWVFFLSNGTFFSFKQDNFVVSKRALTFEYCCLQLLLTANDRSSSNLSFSMFFLFSSPHDVLATLLNNLKVQERQNRVCTTVAIAIVAETCSPFTVLPGLMNEYRVSVNCTSPYVGPKTIFPPFPNDIFPFLSTGSFTTPMAPFLGSCWTYFSSERKRELIFSSLFQGSGVERSERSS